MPEKKIQTVTGPISAEELGRCLIHEHLIWGAPGYWGDYGRYDDETIVQRIVDELEAAQGGPTTVLATGGLAPLVVAESTTINHHVPDLTLLGLRLVHGRNFG